MVDVNQLFAGVVDAENFRQRRFDSPPRGGGLSPYISEDGSRVEQARGRDLYLRGVKNVVDGNRKAVPRGGAVEKLAGSLLDRAEILRVEGAVIRSCHGRVSCSA